jgi:hypothetical protein
MKTASLIIICFLVAIVCAFEDEKNENYAIGDNHADNGHPDQTLTIMENKDSNVGDFDEDLGLGIVPIRK